MTSSHGAAALHYDVFGDDAVGVGEAEVAPGVAGGELGGKIFLRSRNLNRFAYMKKNLTKSILLLALIVMAYAAVAAETGARKAEGAGAAIVCQLSYQAPAETAEAEQKKVNVDMRGAGQALKLGDTAQFEDMEFLTRIARDYLRIDVVDSKTKNAICSHVYNFGKDAKNQFEGDHGFTGLIYVFHPESRAELQFYCTFVERK